MFTHVTVTEESVVLLNDIATQLEEKEAAIKNDIQILREVFEANEDGLGAHSDKIAQFLDDIGANEDDAAKLIRKLVLRLLRQAKVIRRHIQNPVDSLNGPHR